MTELGRTLSGRIRVGRQTSRFSYCLGCAQRITKGQPRAGSSWASALSFDERTRDLLLQAAAEYLELCAEAGEPADPVAFLDWVAVDALRDGAPLIVDHDGAPPRTASGSLAQNHADGSVHRHPWPLPISDWRPGQREGTG